MWFDTGSDFLEVVFAEDPGLLRATDNNAVMERADAEANSLGFSIMNVSPLAKGKPPVAELLARTG